MDSEVRICVPVCERDIDALQRASEQAAAIGDIVELRLDCLSESAASEVSKLLEFPRKLNRPLILTFRPTEQGGYRHADISSRQSFWKANAESLKEEILDIEFDLAQNLVASFPAADWQRIICSHHDFAGVPAELEHIYESMARTPARWLKIAVTAHDAVDCIRIFQLLERAHSEGREMIAVAMGTPGIATRILGPSRGNYLTYGSLNGDRSTAPGQVTAHELRELYRIDRITRKTQVLGLVGLPVGHSISPEIQNSALAAADVDAVYIPFEVRDLGAFIKRMAHPRTRELDWNVRGLSVTAPHKSAVMDFLDWIDPAAKEIGAVNTIIIDEFRLRGYNTDAVAVLKPVVEKLGPLHNARCALIGAGGAARAVLWSLQKQGANVTVFARNLEKGSLLAEKFGARFEALDGSRFNDFDIVINATPLGTHGSLCEHTAANGDQLRGARLAYDLVYNPIETFFLRQAREAGCDTIGGLSMLVLQGAEQFKLWTGIDAPVEVMFEAAKRALSES